MTWRPPTTGELKWRVRFERRDPAGANVGGVVRALFKPLVASRRCRLLPVRGGEVVQEARAQGVSSFELTVRRDRSTAQVTTDDCVVDARDEARVFDVKWSQDLEGRGNWLVMQLELGTGDGRQGAG